MTDRLSVDEYRRLIAATKSAQARPRRAGSTASAKDRPANAVAVLQRLMRRLSIGRLHLKPEEQLAVAFADALRQATLEGRLRAVWTHVANEVAGRQDGKAKIRYSIAKTMGLIDGTADYLFLADTRSGALEAKVGRNGQQPNQADFERWCLMVGVPYRIFRTVEEGLSILSEWGMLDASDEDGRKNLRSWSSSGTQQESDPE